MISIIVSSHKEEFFQEFTKSVKETIGVSYEIIKIYNPGLIGICEAYNLGVQKANYSYICFSHEDITFNTHDWGKIIINDFESNSEIGLIGIAGSAYKSWILSGWHTSQAIPARFVAENVILVTPEKEKKYLTNSTNEKLVEVASIDGCFMFTSAEVLNYVKFDEATFKNFHCYDADFSLQVNEKFKVMVSFNLLLSHYSKGSYTVDWLKETVKLHKKWNKKLPCVVGEINDIEIADQEESAFYGIVNAICSMDKCYYILLKLYFSSTYFKFVGLKKWLKSAYRLLKIIRMYKKDNRILIFVQEYIISNRLRQFILNKL